MTATCGRVVQVNGKWVTCIGNKTVRTGDLVWTDGKCVYGNFIECGQPPKFPVSTLQGIPILSNKFKYINDNNQEKYYTKNQYFYFDVKKRMLKKCKLQPDNFKNVLGIVNNESKVYVLNKDVYIKQKKQDTGNEDTDDQDYILDAEVGSSGDVFVLKNCYVDPPTSYLNSTSNAKIKGGEIYRNEEVIGNYAESIQACLPNAAGDVADKLFRVMAGFIDSEGHYYIYVYVYSYGGDYINETEGYIENDTAKCQYVIITDKGSQVIFQSSTERDFNYLDFDEGEDFNGLYNVQFSSEFKIKSNALKIPMPDDWYFTFEIPSFLLNLPSSVVESFENQNGWSNRANTLKDIFTSYGFADVDVEYYIIKIFNPNDEHILTIETVTLFWKINICTLNNNEYIVQIPASSYNEEYIFLAKKDAVIQMHYTTKSINDSHIDEDNFLSFKDADTGENTIVDTTSNFRLRQLKDLNLYKKAVRKSLAN